MRNSLVRLTLSFICFASIVIAFSGCKDKAPDTLFRLIPSSSSGIDFVNYIEENDSMNMMTFTNFYTGSGVGIADINNDGLQDIYFGGCMTSGKLYLNQGNFKFKDITESSGMTTSRWVSGVSVVDINQDGLDDFYLSVSGPVNGDLNRNLLYINQGDNTFVESAKAYGLDDPAQTTHASFFDYDNDNDLDLFMIINPTDFPLDHMGRAGVRKMDGEALSTDKLYRNNGDGTFSDVSREAGILIEGYSLGLNTSDINNDGWIDIFISNDFTTNDLLYINNGDGTFTNGSDKYLKHTSFASMGNDMADINNDGNLDLFVLDMYPEDNYREKMLIISTSYNAFYYLLGKGYEPQYPRNVLQINNGNGTFSEVGQLAGVDKTDWSWAPIFADYDNDGLKDLFVANGFKRDVGNLDYLNYNTNSPFVNPNADKALQLESIKDQPETKLPNYAYRNRGDLTFEDVSEQWGLNQFSFSNGAATADLDNDGDIDLIVNNINDDAFIYENQSNLKSTFHFLKVKLEGYKGNLSGLGAKVRVVYDGQQQFHEHQVSRGYLSSLENMVHFGFGETTEIDSLQVFWPDGKYSLITQLQLDTLITIQHSDVLEEKTYSLPKEKPIFENVTAAYGLNYKHQENFHTDFNVQPLIPHEHSQNGPGLAVGDVNGDGNDDVFIGGAMGFGGVLFEQSADGFIKHDNPIDEEHEDMGALFFDADNDGDNDLYVVSGGTQYPGDSSRFQDRLYINNGKGDFTLGKLPEMFTSGSCITAADFDNDNDLDLFIGGRIVPGQYPKIPNSYLLENNNGQFIDVTESIPGLSKVGMVTSSLWTDINNDDWVDLIIVGEWMPVTIYENQHGKLVNRTEAYGLSQTKGWWNSITGGDFDQDGDIDYVLGNLGGNTNYEASADRPFRIYAKDFDFNGTIDPIMSQYYGNQEHPVVLRDPLIQQIPQLHRKFVSYDSYARATMADLFSPEELADALILESQTFNSSYLENTGNGLLVLRPLPVACQMAPIFGMQVDDYNGDGYLDVLTVGNSFATNVLVGRYDGYTGHLLLGDGSGQFHINPGNTNGLNLDQDAKALARVRYHDGTSVYIATVNDGALQAYKKSKTDPINWIDPEPGKWKIDVETPDGKIVRCEVYRGSGYLSQHSSSIPVNANSTATVLNPPKQQ